MPACPVCGTRRFLTYARADELCREEGLGVGLLGRHTPLPPAQLLECSFCSALVRDGEQLPAALPPPSLAQAHAATAWLRRLRVTLGRRPQRLLEVGVASRGFLDAAAGGVAQPVGVIDREGPRLQGALPEAVLCADADRLPFEDQDFDAVCLWNAAWEARTLRSVLSEARRVLRPGGVLALRMPNVAVYRVLRGELHGGGTVATAMLEVLAWEGLLGWPYAAGLSPAHFMLLFAVAGFESAHFFPAAHLDEEPRNRRARRARAALLRATRRFPSGMPDWSSTWLEAYATRPGHSRQLWPALVELEPRSA